MIYCVDSDKNKWCIFKRPNVFFLAFMSILERTQSAYEVLPPYNSMIPLNASNNQIYYYFDNTSFSQFIDIDDTYLILNNITVILLDRFGNNINPNGLDWSYPLLIEYLG